MQAKIFHEDHIACTQGMLKFLNKTSADAGKLRYLKAQRRNQAAFYRGSDSKGFANHDKGRRHEARIKKKERIR